MVNKAVTEIQQKNGRQTERESEGSGRRESLEGKRRGKGAKGCVGDRVFPGGHPSRY